jgi:autotransporter-associated beta strand protein
MTKFIIKAASALFLAGLTAPAAEIDSPVTITSTVTFAGGDTISTRDIKIADGATLTILRSGSGAATLFPSLGTGTLSIGPLTDGGAGRIVFRDIYRAGTNGSIFYISTDATVNIAGADFIGNYSGQPTPAGVSGVFGLNAAPAKVTFTDVLFQDNFCYGNTGVVRIAAGTLTVNGGTFAGNYSPNNQTGAIGITTAGANVILNNVLLDSNRAKTTGGAIEIGGIAHTGTWTNVIFKNNWAGTLGGAIRAAHTGGELVFKMTAAGGTNYYNYIGNIAAGSGSAAVTAAAVADNTAPAAEAAAGGFYYASGAGALRFDIDAGVTLVIGDPAAADKNIDSIAGAATAGGIAAKIIKTGGGDLILNADNSNWRGSVEITNGRLLLGNNAALLGAAAITGTGASAFGGLGTVANAGAPGAANVSISDGASLQVGVAGAGDGTLAIDGTLALANAAITYVPAGTGVSSKLARAGVTFAISGTNIINMQGFATGIYSIGAAALYNDLSINGTGTLLFAANGDITLSPDARQGAKLINDADDFLVGVWTARAARIKYNGPDTGAAWNNSDNHWAGLNDAGIVKFASGDLVEFQAGAQNRALDIIAPVAVAGLLVAGDRDTVFNGAGGITATQYATGDAETDVIAGGGGRLIKQGAGALVLNNGANVFNGGVYINAGAVEIARGDQLQTGAAPVVFAGAATLRVTGSATISSNINIVTGVAAVVDTAGAGGFAAFAGPVAGAGTLVKDGAGVLVLDAANTHAAIALRAGTLLARHDSALGAGALSVTGAGAARGVRGGVTVSNNMNLNGNTLRVYNALAGAGEIPAAVLAGAVSGGSLEVFRAVSGGPVLLSGANMLNALAIKSGANVTAGAAGARGGATSAVSVESGGAVVINQFNTQAASVRVFGGGTISFRDAGAAAPLLKIGGDFILDEGSVVDLGGAPSGTVWLADAASIINNATIEAGGAEISIGTGGGDLRVTKINPAIYAGKDVASAFDAMTATAGAVHARVAGGFFMPVAGAGAERDFWARGIGGFSDYKASPGRAGFDGRTVGGVAGYDRTFSNRLLAGGYVGFNYNSIKTDNRTETRAGMPFAGVYGAAKFGRLHFTADFMAGTLDADTSRFEQTGYARGNYNAVLLGAGAGAGFVINPWKDGAIKPALSIYYMGLDYKEQSENGPGAVLVDDFHAARWDGFMRVLVSQNFTLARRLPGAVDFTLGWRTTLRAAGADVTAQLSNNYGDKVHIGAADDYKQRAACVAGLALRLALGKQAALGLAADYESGRDHHRLTLAATLRRNW